MLAEKAKRNIVFMAYSLFSTRRSCMVQRRWRGVVLPCIAAKIKDSSKKKWQHALRSPGSTTQHDTVFVATWLGKSEQFTLEKPVACVSPARCQWQSFF